MTVLPVIGRELRASARQPFTYHLRLFGVAALLLVGLRLSLRAGGESLSGRELFEALHRTLLGAIWVLVPMLTADCISRERREGTLGLLFLTPLRWTDIVVAKGLAHGLRAVTLGLAVLPVLTIPFLMGGVSWAEGAVSVIVNVNVMCWALAAGLLASAWSKAWSQALLRAAILVTAFLFLFAVMSGWLVLQTSSIRRTAPVAPNWGNWMAVGLAVAANLGGCWSEWLRLSPLSEVAWVLGQATFWSLLALVAAVWAAGARTRRSWREEPPPQWQVELEETFCTPVLWLGFFRRWMRRKLERNPIGWLQQRTWSGRLVTWGWVVVLVSVYSAIFTERFFTQAANPMQETMAWFLAGSMAATAAGSFRRERETGVLELLLVSPLGEGQIISGRLRGLWGQFLLAAGLLLVLWAYCSTFLPNGSGAGVILFYAVLFVNVPVIGLYFSLRCRNFLTAFLFTAAVGLLLPLAVAELITYLRWTLAASNTAYSFQMRPSVPAAAFQLALAGGCWWLLQRRLKQRAFPLERTMGS
jgi:ABC-type transport system involved in multi-copper enzyme maturation permease subunit